MEMPTSKLLDFPSPGFLILWFEILDGSIRNIGVLVIHTESQSIFSFWSLLDAHSSAEIELGLWMFMDVLSSHMHEQKSGCRMHALCWSVLR